MDLDESEMDPGLWPHWIEIIMHL
ncbi:uncharacterized protein G2W53_001006 [Senna tora]|uniref:Uncharacterized protein n=1 Tax=Senna tora TaxID=362788 RepID=A0A834XHN0_9FABA|nr:uncharacterized protein G2W53_001006 [Senna tora]